MDFLLHESQEGLKIYAYQKDFIILYLPVNFNIEYFKPFLTVLGCKPKNDFLSLEENRYWIISREQYPKVVQAVNNYIAKEWTKNKVVNDGDSRGVSYDHKLFDICDANMIMILNNHEIQDRLDDPYETNKWDPYSDVAQAYWKEKFPDLKRGNLIAIDPPDYRNDGVYIYNGKNVEDLYNDLDDYGSIGPNYHVISDFPIKYWSQYVGHNRIVWVSFDFLSSLGAGITYHPLATLKDGVLVENRQNIIEYEDDIEDIQQLIGYFEFMYQGREYRILVEDESGWDDDYEEYDVTHRAKTVEIDDIDLQSFQWFYNFSYEVLCKVKEVEEDRE